MSPSLPLWSTGIAILAILSYRDLRVLFTALIAALVANLFLPFSPFGITVTSQRLVSLVALGVCLALFLQGRIAIPRPNGSQLGFAVTYGVLVAIHALHLIASPSGMPLSSLLGAALNPLLFYLSLILLHNLRPEDRRSLFTRWLPCAVLAVMTVLVGSWMIEMLARSDLGATDFQQRYRMRNTEGRNIVNVWGASLVLAVPFIWQPLFTSVRLRWKAVSFLAVGITILAVILTFSRAALFATGVLVGGVLLLVVIGRVREAKLKPRLGWLQGASRLAAVLGLAGSACLALEWAGLPVVDWAVERTRPVLAGTDRSLQVRLSRYETAKELLEGLPVLGYGPGAETIERLPENTLIFITLHYGALALACLIVMLSVIGWQLAVYWWPRRDHPYAAAWPAAYLAYIFLLLTNDFLFFSMGTILLATTTFATTGRTVEVPTEPSRQVGP